MKHTSALSVLVAAIAGMTVGYLAQSILVSHGLAMLVPPLTLPATLVIAAVALLVLAWPVRQSVRGKRPPVNQLMASRVAVLAKASTLSGALLTGFTAGLGYFALTRTVIPGGSTIVLLVVAVVAAVLLLVAGLVAERFCTLPPDDPDAEPKIESPPSPEGAHG